MTQTTQPQTGMLDASFLESCFSAAGAYSAYVGHGNEDQQANWARVYDSASLTPQQREVVEGFTRQMRVLVTSGMWCGDCAAQCPLMQRIHEACPAMIDLRFVDRDDASDLAARISINEGLRVPTAIFMAEDFVFVHLLGDRSLTRYRAVADRQLGGACPLPGAPIPKEEQAATLQDWVNEFERVQLLLRLSPRLREKHGD